MQHGYCKDKGGARVSGVAGTQTETASGCKRRAHWGELWESEFGPEPLSSVFLSRPANGHSSCGVCCPMNFPKAFSPPLPKMLLNGSPFHSPVQPLMAFSSRRAAQLNQPEACGQRKSAGETFAVQRKMFSFPS